ncbi:uncharacterized protein LOC132263285 [Phlebotomus argentipes]|uniref:uncharacterized protein LOC132263285 n=1 Tax=Phlebotomus argentipes TaxID=94469 RepID=UPI0028930914|nr:uncharacterized protein LOC132263285 [Phlebotomus argentipes]
MSNLMAKGREQEEGNFLPLDGNTRDSDSKEKEELDEPEHILPDDPILERTLTPALIKRRRKTLSSFNEDGSYVSSICKSVKLRQRRKSIYMNDEEAGAYVNNKEEEKRLREMKKQVGKIRERRKSVALVNDAFTSPRPSRITKRRQTMFAANSCAVSTEERLDSLDIKEEFPEPSKNSLWDDIQSEELSSQPDSVSEEMQSQTSQTSQTLSCTESPMSSFNATSSSGSSRRKSLLKPMETEVKFERIISYRNPTIPFHGKYKAALGALNKLPHKNERLMRRLAMLKVIRQYFRTELSLINKTQKASRKTL